jgi:hypothetical protein
MGIGRKWKEIIDFADKLTYNAHVSSVTDQCFQNYMKPVSKKRIHGYLNMSTRGKRTIIFEGRTGDPFELPV